MLAVILIQLKKEEIYHNLRFSENQPVNQMPIREVDYVAYGIIMDEIKSTIIFIIIKVAC